ncbi:hypothetical protein H4Q26_005529 [Puccinia striiformis f. sp. tritici PST-130]|nr:hypothetical protein H4Q26_005529 [Puccinia striiformis f. sp. tritici PST-130]
MKLHDMMVKQFRKITAHEDHRVDLEDHSLAEIKLRLGDIESKVDQLHVVPENQERTSEQLSSAICSRVPHAEHLGSQTRVQYGTPAPRNSNTHHMQLSEFQCAYCLPPSA